MLYRVLQQLGLSTLIIPAVFTLGLDGSFAESTQETLKERRLSLVNPGQSIVERSDADEQFTLIKQENTEGSETTDRVDGEEKAGDKSEISIYTWAIIAAVLGFGFGGFLALRNRAKAKKG